MKLVAQASGIAYTQAERRNTGLRPRRGTVKRIHFSSMIQCALSKHQSALCQCFGALSAKIFSGWLPLRHANFHLDTTYIEPACHCHEWTSFRHSREQHGSPGLIRTPIGWLRRDITGIPILEIISCWLALDCQFLPSSSQFLRAGVSSTFCYNVEPDNTPWLLGLQGILWNIHRISPVRIFNQKVTNQKTAPILMAKSWEVLLRCVSHLCQLEMFKWMLPSIELYPTIQIFKPKTVWTKYVLFNAFQYSPWFCTCPQPQISEFVTQKINKTFVASKTAPGFVFFHPPAPNSRCSLSQRPCSGTWRGGHSPDPLRWPLSGRPSATRPRPRARTLFAFRFVEIMVFFFGQMDTNIGMFWCLTCLNIFSYGLNDWWMKLRRILLAGGKPRVDHVSGWPKTLSI